MKYFIIVAVKDELTDTFMQPVFGESQEELERIFKYQINSIPLWKENADDYSLYKLGEFNDNNGQIISDIKKLMGGRSAVKKEENE